LGGSGTERGRKGVSERERVEEVDEKRQKRGRKDSV